MSKIHYNSSTSFRKQDNCCTPHVKQCANQTCGRWFDVTEDIRQLYCCKPCSVSEASRRKNKRKRDQELRLNMNKPITNEPIGTIVKTKKKDDGQAARIQEKLNMKITEIAVFVKSVAQESTNGQLTVTATNGGQDGPPTVTFLAQKAYFNPRVGDRLRLIIESAE